MAAPRRRGDAHPGGGAQGAAQPARWCPRAPHRLDRRGPARSSSPDGVRCRHGAPAAAGPSVAAGGRGATGVMSDERLARVALARMTEPGEPKIASLVAELGAVRVRELLSDPLEETPEALDVASRLHGLEPEADLERGARLGLRYVVPGDDEWPIQVDDLSRAELLEQRGGPPLGLW